MTDEGAVQWAEEFLKDYGGSQPFQDLRTLTRLARRGLETRWRPIEDWNKGDSYVSPHGKVWHCDDKTYPATPFWVCEELGFWRSRGNAPKFGIPLSFLGTPEETE